MGDVGLAGWGGVAGEWVGLGGDFVLEIGDGEF